MYQQSLFEVSTNEPLASRMSPNSLTEFVGQKHLIGQGKLLKKMIESDNISSMIFWGRPGVGKTTLARIIAHEAKSKFITFSAVTSGIKGIFTAHGGNLEDIKSNPILKSLFDLSIIERIILIEKNRNFNLIYSK